MAEERVQRRLTTILAADAVGFSRLMREDEETTLRTLNEYREVIDALVARHEGRIFNTAGDAVLAEFGSAVEAVRCAISCQEEIASRNVELPDDRKLVFRMGINVGDVMVRDDDLFGDGVNVAARLEGLSEPGGLCVSSSVFEQVKHKLSMGFEDLGPQEVKNINEPVSAFRLVPGSVSVSVGSASAPKTGGGRRWRVAAIGAAAVVVVAVAVGAVAVAVGAVVWQPWAPDFKPVTAQEMALPLPDKPSIAVLPFTNISSDREQEYFADGMTEDIINNLSKVSGLFVIARTSTMRYKGKQVDVRQVSRDLGVRYVLEGSVRKAAENVRITAQLVDATSGRQLWAERYDRRLADVFAIQDEISEMIVASAAVTLDPAESKKVRRERNPNSEAYDYYLQGLVSYVPPSPKNLAESRSLLEKALSLDPQFAEPYGLLSFVHFLRAVTGAAKSPKEAMGAALRVARKGIEIDDKNAGAYRSQGLTLLYSRRLDEAEIALKKALTLTPGDARTRAVYAQFLHFSGNPSEGVELAKQAYRANPSDMVVTYYLGANYRAAGQYQQAIDTLKRRRQLFGRPDPNPDLNLAAAYILSGKKVEARAVVQAILKAVPHYNVRAAIRGAPYKRSEDLKLYLDAIRAAGLPEG